jgi:hypothetical protein
MPTDRERRPDHPASTDNADPDHLDTKTDHQPTETPTARSPSRGSKSAKPSRAVASERHQQPTDHDDTDDKKDRTTTYCQQNSLFSSIFQRTFAVAHLSIVRYRWRCGGWSG